MIESAAGGGKITFLRVYFLEIKVGGKVQKDFYKNLIKLIV